MAEPGGDREHGARVGEHAGVHDFALDASALAPGLYVVTARVTAEDGRAWTAVRRVTVTR